MQGQLQNYLRFFMKKSERIYKQMIHHFGSVQSVANYFGVSHQAVYQWQFNMPATRAREFDLVKKLAKT